MANKYFLTLIRWWVTPKLPREHIFISLEKRPEGFFEIIKVYFLRWIAHPIKRRIARYYLILLKKFFDITVIAVTGSAGKTTTKEMIASILSQRFKTVWTKGNIDPIYGIPDALLRTRLGTRRLVLEMGIEYPGEMDFYLWLAQPQTGVVTTIYWTHTEFLESLKNVVYEKGKLVELLSKDGYAVLNYDDPRVRSLAERTKAKVIWYGASKRAYVRAENIKFTKDLKTSFKLRIGEETDEVTLQLLGQQFVTLALAAAAVGLVNGLSTKDIKRGLEKVETQPHRMVPIKLGDRTLIIDDTYNANPLGTIEAIKVLSEVGKGKRKILVLGEMKELGKFEKKGHREVGAFAAERKIDMILGLGELTKFTLDEAAKKGANKENLVFFHDKKQLISYLKGEIKQGDVILVKGSRSMAMEEVVDSLTK